IINQRPDPYAFTYAFSTALRLAKFFGISPDFWLNLQMRWELYKAQKTENKEIESIQDYKHVQKMA
ncbi:MAG: hypothetical protein KAR12_16745, partial [Methylococcales bacterium]|nr:hypothetical protein [Methylococcales bacterium]